jgi:hypothetical protein
MLGLYIHELVAKELAAVKVLACLKTSRRRKVSSGSVMKIEMKGNTRVRGLSGVSWLQACRRLSRALYSL